MKNLAYYGYQLSKMASTISPNMASIRPPQPVQPAFDQSPVNLPQSVQGSRVQGPGGNPLDGEIQQDQMQQEIQKQVEMQTQEHIKQLDDMKKQLDAAHKSMQAHQSEVARHQGEASKQRQIADKVREQASKELDAARSEKTKEMHAVHLDAHQARLEAARLAEEAKLHEAQIEHLNNIHKMTQSTGDRSADMPHVAQAQIDAFLGKVKGIRGDLFKSAVTAPVVPTGPAAPKGLSPEDIETKQNHSDELRANPSVNSLSSGQTLGKKTWDADSAEAYKAEVKSQLAGWHSSENPYDKTGLPNTTASNPAYHMMENAAPTGLKTIAHIGDMINRKAENFVNMDPDYYQNAAANSPKYFRPLAAGAGYVRDKMRAAVASPFRHGMKMGENAGNFSVANLDGSRNWGAGVKALEHAAGGAFDLGTFAAGPIEGLGWGAFADAAGGNSRYSPEEKVGVGYQSPEQMAAAQSSLEAARDKYTSNGSTADMVKQPWYAQYMQHAGYEHPEMIHHTLPGYAMMDNFRRQNPTLGDIVSMAAPFVMPHVNADKLYPNPTGQPDGSSEWARLQSTLPLMASGY